MKNILQQTLSQRGKQFLTKMVGLENVRKPSNSFMELYSKEVSII